jgi:CheY-like chemotaxis protein
MAPRILVVDDGPMVRALIARALSDEGYEVVSGLNGAELIARVRQDFPALPILHIDDITRRRAKPDLPDDVPTVYKPFSVATLREAVRRLLAG